MATSPITSKTDLPSYEILIDGNVLAEHIPVLSIQVKRNLFKLSTARIVLYDGDADAESFDLSQDTQFDPGKEVEIKLGYHHTNTTVFKGVITKHDIRIKAYRNKVVSELILDCSDKAFKMDVVRKSACFLKKKDSDIIKKAVSDSGLSCTAEATSTEHACQVQYDCTDWDYINIRAQANGMVLINQDGKIEVQKPKLSGTATLKVNHSIVESFHASLDGTQQVKSASYESWDPKDQKLVASKSTEPKINKLGNAKGATVSKISGDPEVTHSFSAFDQKTSLDDLVEGRLLNQRMAMYSGHIRFVGSASIAIGELLTIEGFGSRFDGDLYVSGFTHEVREGRWFTSAEFGLPAIPYEQEVGYKLKPRISIGIPPIQGLHIGKVKSLSKDPNGAYRVEVTLQTLSIKETIFARLIQPYASKQAGFFFLPEIDDEVLVGFLDNDPRNAIILGSMYSVKNPPFFPMDNEENKVKAISTPEKIVLKMDDEDKVLTLETPGKHQIEINDKDKKISLKTAANQEVSLDDDKKSVTLKDQNGNMVSLDDKGITLKSASNITLQATQDIELKGTNIKLAANAALSAKANATAEVSASATLTLKGALVQIN